MDKPVTFLVSEMVWLMNQHAERRLRAEFGISFSWFLLMVTLQPVQPVSQHDLASCLSYSDAAVSKLLAKLTTAGYVKVIVDPSHQRKRLVTLTEAGDSLVTVAAKALEEDFLQKLVRAGVDTVQYTDMNTKIRDLLIKEQS